MGIRINFIVKKTEDKYYCMICNCNISGSQSVSQHLDGRRHESSLQQFGHHIEMRSHNHQYFCKCCGCKVYGWVNIYPHLTGKKHTVRLNRIDESLATCKGLPCDFIVRKSDNHYFCTLCNVPISGPIPAKGHREGSRHAASMEQYGDDIVLIKNNHHYYCRLCKCKFLGYYHIWGHINGKRHRAFMNEE